MGAADPFPDNPNRERAGDPAGYSGIAGVGGGSSLLRRWRPISRDAAGDSLRVLPLQRAQIRELARVNPIAAGALNTNVDRVVGTGLALVARPNYAVLGMTAMQATEWKRRVQTEFALWADSTDCDFEGEQTFYAKQALTLRSALESGDCFTLLPDGVTSPSQPYKLRLQTLEADRIGNPDGKTDSAFFAGGIKRTAGGGKDCFVYDTHPGAVFVMNSAASANRYAGQWISTVGTSGRRRLLHHFRQLRPEQPRGVPYLAPVVEHLKQLGRYTEAEIQAAVMSAMFTVFIEREGGGSAAPLFGLADTQLGIDGEIGLAPGAVIDLAPGEKANFADPGRPNANFELFVKAIIQQIGVGLGIPFELLTKQFAASYSASKAALLDAWVWFRGMRTWVAGSFCQPVYETWLAEAVASNRIAAPGFFTDPLIRWGYTRAQWHGDSMGTINPKDDVTAYSLAIDARLMTREQAEWELFGSDWYDTFAQKEMEQTLLAAANLLPVAAPGSPGSPGSPGAPKGTDTPHSPGTPAQGQT